MGFRDLMSVSISISEESELVPSGLTAPSANSLNKSASCSPLLSLLLFPLLLKQTRDKRMLKRSQTHSLKAIIAPAHVKIKSQLHTQPFG